LVSEYGHLWTKRNYLWIGTELGIPFSGVKVWTKFFVYNENPNYCLFGINKISTNENT